MSRKKNILAINFFPSFTPPKSGGELRYYNIYRFLSAYYNINMVNPTHLFVEPEVVRHLPNMIEHRIPKGDIHYKLHRILGALGKFKECSAAVVMLAAPYYQPFIQKVNEFLPQADIVIHECPFLAPLAKKKEGQILIYDSYNVEYDLHKDMLPGLLGGIICGRVKKAERKICHLADLVFATSEEDRQRISQLYDVSLQKIIVIPNGVDTELIKPATPEERSSSRQMLNLDDNPAILFFGSAHPPNIAAVEFILQKLSPDLPDSRFLIAGDVGKHFEGRGTANVRFLGRVSDEEKMALLHGCDLAVNPMFSGSGTNLKMFDYLSSGLPVVSTPIGARGIALANYRDAVITEADGFAEAIKEIEGRPDLMNHLAQSGRRFVEEHFNWKGLVARIHESIKQLNKPKVTVIGDYDISSPRHGGQYRMHNIYKELSRRMPVCHLCHQKETDEIIETQIDKNFIQYAIPKGFWQRVMESLLGRWMGFSVDDILGVLFTHHNPLMRREAAQSALFGDILVCEHPFHWKVISGHKNCLRLYESQNYETKLKEKMLHGLIGRILLGLVRRIEKRAVLESDAIVTVSDEEGEAFIKDFGIPEKCATIPNGTDTVRIAPPPISEKSEIRRQLGLPDNSIGIFVGSAHPPNVEAGRVIVEEIAPRVPYVLFFIVGSVCWILKNLPTRPPNVKLFFEVEEPVRNILLKISDLAVNPMITGAGTSLKMFDFMAAGLPIISTPLGARGMDSRGGDVMIRCETQQFAESIEALLRDNFKMMKMGTEGRRYVEENFDWGVIAERYHTLLTKLSAGGVISGKKEKNLASRKQRGYGRDNLSAKK